MTASTGPVDNLGTTVAARLRGCVRRGVRPGDSHGDDPRNLRLARQNADPRLWRKSVRQVTKRYEQVT